MVAQQKVPRARRRWVGWVAGGVAAALVVTLAVVAQGFDSRETPREDPSLWVERSAGQYARVNTETAEIDTVRAAESPSGVVQTGELGVLLTQGFGRAWTIDPARPVDVQNDGTDESGADEEADAEDENESGNEADVAVEDSAASEAEDAERERSADGGASMRTPDGTRQVTAAGKFVLFFTQGGEAYLSRVNRSAAGQSASLDSPAKLDPFAEQRERQAEDEDEIEAYLADAAALDENGLVALYSRAEQAIRWYDASADRWRGDAVRVNAEGLSEQAQLAIVNGEWVLFDAASGRLWQQSGGDAVELAIVGNAKLQASTTASDEVLVADDDGLWQVGRDGSAERIAQASGAAAQPRRVGDETIAAWVGASEARMWTSSEGDRSLELDSSVEDLNDPEPEIRSNGSRALVVERRSGMMWTVPSGALIPVEQWSLVDPPKQESGTVVTQDVTEQEPPVAVDDAFGVRAGEPALLPVLLNDFDPNRKDVLTVVSEGLGDGLGEEFATATPLSDGQGVLVQPSGSARGTATFSYRITDGVNVSAPATVTLTVVDPAVNTAPDWCLVEGCQRSWPSPELAPGGTLIMPILEGWVDAEGDPMMLSSASVSNVEDPLRALVTSDGKLAIRHTDPNAEAGDSVVVVRVVDSHGEERERDLRVRVRTGAALEFTPAAMTAKVGEATLLRPLERVSGGSGSFQLADAVVQQGALSVTVNQGRGSIEVSASAPGNAIIAVTVRDTVTEQETVGTVRVTAVEKRASFGVPPLRAFVRPLADSTVDVLAAVPGANSRALTVQSAAVRDGQLRADVIEHSRVRVSGSTPDGQPGRIGSVDVTVAEGEATGVGRLTVFQVQESGGAAIAVTDTASVRAGSVVDIPVLENDVAPPGERLVLHPEVGSSGAEGELAFASGGNVRYLAPKLPGNYTLSYTTYGASSPEQSDVGQVRVTVLPAGANRDPLPATVTVRVAPGERVSASVPLSGVDPDGDRLRLVAVGAPEDPQVSASIQPRSSLLQVEASTAAQRGTSLVSYTVRDSFGGEAEGKLRIIVTEPDPGGGAPVVYSDYVRIARSSTTPASVRPLDNDIDPSGGTLELVSVEPNVPDGEASPLYRELESRLDLSRLKQGVVLVSGGELGTVSYKYTVRSSKSKSTAQGLIVVQVSERIGQQAPAVADTVLSVRDRSDFERVGVDVVTDRVRWAAGDVSTLQLSLWGGTAGSYRVEGSSIRGEYRAEGDLVPFRLVGVDMTGIEVESFGFLIVPPLDELRLGLKPGVQAVSVNENKSVDIRVADMLDLGSGDRVELAEGDFSVQRQQASCTMTGSGTVRYTAGKEAPWVDSCTVRVRLVEQKTYTLLPIPITIVPDDPVVQLNPLTRTISPGQSETINLLDMVQWQGGREGKTDQLRWQAAGGGASFEIAASGAQLQATALANAVPGSQEPLTVTVSGAGETHSVLTLRVGEAAVDAPRGGTVSLQCTVGVSCQTSLIGVGGQYDPFAGKSGGGLKLVSVEDGGCRFGTLQAAGDSVNVSWSDARGPGGRCTAGFTVKDAQNRVGTGTIELDALGVPRAPASITATGADATSVTLTVALNSEGAHPEVSGVEVLNSGGSPVGSCTLSGSGAVCRVSDVGVGRENGQRYYARAVNSVGASDQTSSASEATWAYIAPPAPVVIAEPVKNPNNTDQVNGQVRLQVSGSDRARRFLLLIDSDPNRIEIGRTSTHPVQAGFHTFSVIPEDRDLPPGYSGTSEGSAGEASATVGAAPSPVSFLLGVTGETSAEITDSWNVNYADSVEYKYAVRDTNSGAPSCSGAGASKSFTGLTRFRSYAGIICAQSEFGKTEVLLDPVWVGGVPGAPTVNSGYRIGGAAYENGTVREYTTVTQQPSVSGLVGGAWLRYLISTGGSVNNTLTAVPVGASVQVQQCLSGGGAEHCSDPVDVPAAGPLSTRITWDGACIAPASDASLSFTVEGRPAGDFTFTISGQNVRVGAGNFSDAWYYNVICAPEPEPEPPPGG